MFLVLPMLEDQVEGEHHQKTRGAPSNIDVQTDDVS